jgi:hypothetical protein
MRTRTIAALAAVLALGCSGAPALAQDDGLPDNPNSNANTIPGPDATTPSDPAADDDPAARVPTTENEGYEVRREGSSRGTSGEGMEKEQPDK